ncbi:Zinc finger CCCH domain-containing protein 36 [Striga hermonthica]|uniref:Zinc finger CCCH domain-containing protein 36 n=1 Tax=Striga hermonthica TaxID=68872 RepID=A0A9N7N674_STRHE|nr:Zinc finger CCCH domain-containing protein 36 [Striga hermonthica]
MEFGGPRKRGRFEGGLNGNGGFKKSKQEMESNTPGIGSKSKPCTKFFSASGCPFGEGCHFLHYVPGGIKAVTQILGNNPALPPNARNPMGPPSFPDGSSPPAVKTRLCNRFASGEGCKYGDKCNFAHGEHELGRPTFLPPHDDPRSMMGIKQASQMVHELVANVSSMSAGPPGKGQGGSSYGPGSSNFKTKLCENFMKGSCTFGDKCHFAHGMEELRKSGI